MNINYSQKYLKYKNKYLNIKNNIKNKYQYGGSSAIISNQDIDPDLSNFDAPVGLVLPLSLGVSNGPDNLDDLDDFGEPPRFPHDLLHSLSIQDHGGIVKERFDESFKNRYNDVLNIIVDNHSCRDLLEELVKNLNNSDDNTVTNQKKYDFRERFSPNMGEPLYIRFTEMINELFI